MKVSEVLRPVQADGWYLVLSYALAKVRNVALLYKGGDFAQTDIRSAVEANL